MTTSGEAIAHERAASALRPGPAIPGHTIQYNEHQHTWIIDQTLLSCSPTEYCCLRLLLERVERCVTYADFIAQFQEGSLADGPLQKQARMKVAHLMSKLREKLWPLGLDIGNVMGIGYILLRSESFAYSVEQER